MKKVLEMLDARWGYVASPLSCEARLLAVLDSRWGVA